MLVAANENRNFHSQSVAEKTRREKRGNDASKQSRRLHFPYWHNGAADGLTLLAIIIIALASGRRASERAMIFSTQPERARGEAAPRCFFNHDEREFLILANEHSALWAAVPAPATTPLEKYKMQLQRGRCTDEHTFGILMQHNDVALHCRLFLAAGEFLLYGSCKLCRALLYGHHEPAVPVLLCARTIRLNCRDFKPDLEELPAGRQLLLRRNNGRPSSFWLQSRPRMIIFITYNVALYYGAFEAYVFC